MFLVPITGVPTLKSIQNMVYRAKKKKVAGVQLMTREQLYSYCEQYYIKWEICRQITLNPTAEYIHSLIPQEYLCIPQFAATYHVDGACFTGPRQINWIRQLSTRDGRFVLHLDGKHKLHHGVWVLITLGTHCLSVKGQATARDLTNTFIPLIYLFCKDNESTAACSMVSSALNMVSLKCFEKKLCPGAMMTDHSAGARAGLRLEWNVPHGQCWPHIIRKFKEGGFCSKKHPHFEDVKRHLYAIHNAQSDAMRDFLSIHIGDVWDSFPAKWNLNSFWNEYMVSPWDNWSLGSFSCMLCTPSQQAQESWHKQILTTRIPGMFKGSTESVFEVALPKLIRVDGIIIPDELLFHVPAIPSGLMEEALWYIRHQTTMVVSKDETFYFLSDDQTHFKRVDDRLVARYESLMRGERPRGVTSLNEFMDIAASLHKCFAAAGTGRTAVLCEYNEAELVCTCKFGRAYGICSHILVANHIIGHINILRLTGNISGEKRRRGGYNRGVRPALVREDQPESGNRRRQAPRASLPSAESVAQPNLPPSGAPTSPQSPNALQDYIAEVLVARSRRAEDEAAIRARVSEFMTREMDTGIRVNRALQDSMNGES